MLSYTHFTLEERKYLQQLLREGLSLRKIAAILERSPSSVSREVKRNKAKWKPHRKPDNPYWYNHWRAQNLSIQRRRDNEAVKIDESMEDLFGKVMNQNFVPVVDDKRVFIGIVTRKDILAYLGKKAAAQENGVRGMDQA